MVFPTIPTAAANTLLSSTTATASTTHTFPSLTTLAPAAGDLLIAVIIQYSGAGTAGAEFSGWGASFTQIVDLSRANTTDVAVGVARKIAAGGETGTFTVTSASSKISTQFLMRIPAGYWHGTTIPEVSTFGFATGAVADAPALNPANWDVEDTLWIAVYGHSETTTTGSPPDVSSPPTNYSGQLIVARTADAVGAVASGVAFRQNAVASEDVGVWTVANPTRGNGGALAIAVRPHAALVQAVDDVRGLTDSGTAVNYQGVITDERGLFDQVTVEKPSGPQTFEVPVDDNRGLVDSVVVERTAPITLDDNRGLVDSLATEHVINLTIDDNRGLVDSLATEHVINLTIDDLRNITDDLGVYLSPHRLDNAAEGTDGTNLTISNSGPDNFNTINKFGTGLTIQFSTAHAHMGTSSIKVHQPGIFGVGSVRWNFPEGIRPAYARTYIYLESRPSSTDTFNFFGLGDSLNLIMYDDGHIYMTNGSGSFVGSMSSVIPLNQWVRLEIEVTNASGTTGDLRTRMFSGANLETNTADTGGTISATGTYIGTAPADLRFGNNPGGTMTIDAWFDDIAYSVTGAPGPSQPILYVPVNDDRGLTDSVALEAIHASEINDDRGLVDAVAVEETHVVALSDDRGLVDSLTTEHLINLTINDDRGLVDDPLVSKSAAGTVGVDDDRGLTDSGLKVTYSGVLTEARGLSDVLDVSKSIVLNVPVNDDRGLTDAGQALTIGIVVDDERGLTDATSRTVNLVIADDRGLVDDPLVSKSAAGTVGVDDGRGLIDALTVEHGMNVAVDDNRGVTDALSSVHDIIWAVDDSRGLVDPLTVARDINLTLNDDRGVSDTNPIVELFVGSVTWTVPVNDERGLVDSLAVEHSMNVAATDDRGLVDPLTIEHGMNVAINEDRGLVDGLTSVHDVSLTINDDRGLVDTATPSKSSSGIVDLSDDRGLTDGLVTEHFINLTINDDRGLIESVSALNLKTVAVDDNRGITDALIVEHGLNVSVDDDRGLTDAVSTVHFIDLTINEDRGLVDTALPAKSSAGEIAVTDDRGLSDALVTEHFIDLVLNEDRGLTDPLSTERGINITINDPLDRIDSLTMERLIDLIIDDSLGRADNTSILVSSAGVVTINEDRGLLDLLEIELTKVRGGWGMIPIG